MLNTFFIFFKNLKTVLINSVKSPVFLNIVASFTILGIMSILLIYYPNNEYTIMLFSCIISFLFTMFCLDKFSFSNNNFLAIAQKFVLYMFIIILTASIYSYFLTPIYCSSNEDDLNNVKDLVKVTVTNKDTYNFSVSKPVFDAVAQSATEISKTIITHVVPHVASGSAAGVLGAAAIKSTASMPLGARVLTVGATTGVGAFAAKLGVDAASVITNHASSSIKKSTHADTNIDRVPSPDQNFDISSMLESSEVTSPLFILIRIEFLLNLLILILIISFLILIFNKYLLSYNLELITKFLNKFSFLNRLNA